MQVICSRDNGLPNSAVFGRRLLHGFTGSHAVIGKYDNTFEFYSNIELPFINLLYYLSTTDRSPSTAVTITNTPSINTKTLYVVL